MFNNSILKIVLIICTVNVLVYPQRLWDYPPDKTTYLILGNDTSIVNLEKILQNDSLKNEIVFFEAAHLLAYYDSDSYREYILNKLKHFTNLNDPNFSWSRYFRYQLLRGYLGNAGAIDGLDSVVQFSNELSLKLEAISWLVEVGKLDYFDIVLDALLHKGRDVGSIIAEYGRDARFTSEAISILSHVISDSTDYIKISTAARNLTKIDKTLAIELLHTRFLNEMGDRRLDLFYDLGVLDPDGQPERSMIAIPLENDEFNRNSYFPVSYEFVEKGIITRRYLSMFWIKFIKDWYQLENDEMIKSSIQLFIKEFRPTVPDSNQSNIELLDSLFSIIDKCLTFSWLGDISFSNDLKNILTTAKTNLQNGDSLTCRVQVKAFQDLVDRVYKDSLNTDPRFVTIEGWKFLYWNAQYILDRLPEPPVIANADIEVINPAMSMVNPGSFTMEVKGTGFTTNSTVYFNGNARTTTVISDSVLNAQILSTDVSTAGNFPVWVSDGTTNSDTLIFSVVTTLPKPVRPVLECVRNNGDGTYTAYFGYKNENSVSVYIPVGSKNKFTPTPQDRGQTRVFLPGRNYRVFTVNFNGSNLVWTLNGRTSTASSNSAPCN